MHIATRGDQWLDHFYTSIKEAYRAEPRLHFGNSDHIAVKLVPVYSSLVKPNTPVQRDTRVWPEEVITTLQDWLFFREDATHEVRIDMEEYTAAVTDCISKCTEDVIVSKKVTTRANQKPLMSAEVWRELKAWVAAFRSV